MILTINLGLKRIGLFSILKTEENFTDPNLITIS
jgi:hypothetical protein